MKNTIFILAQCFIITLLSSTTHAQIAKGTKAIGTHIKYKFDVSLNNNQVGKASSDLVFLPNVSLFVTDKTAVGVGVGYRRVKNLPEALIIENDPNQPFIAKTSTNSSFFLMSTFVQRYYMFADRFGGVLDIQGNFQTGKMRYQIGNDHFNENRINVELGPAIRFIFLATEHLGLEIGYEPVRLIGTNLNGGFHVSGNFDPMVLLGMRYFID